MEQHYSKITHWPWKYFKPKEIACKGDGLIVVDVDAMNKLERFRELANVPVIINSGYRSKVYNTKVGGAPNSKHMKGTAFDIRITDKLDRDTIHKLASLAGFLGFGDYPTFVHIDTGPKRYWRQ